jgi:hypothetical protein
MLLRYLLPVFNVRCRFLNWHHFLSLYDVGGQTERQKTSLASSGTLNIKHTYTVQICSRRKPFTGIHLQFSFFFLQSLGHISQYLGHSSHIEHNSSLCGLNYDHFSLLCHKMHSMTTSFKFPWIIFSLRHNHHQNSMYLQANFSKLLNLSSKPNITQNWIRQQFATFLQ